MAENTPREPEGISSDPGRSPQPDAGDAVQMPEKVSAFHNAWEIEAKARREAELAERERRAAEEEEAYQAREAYAKELQEEKVALIRMKQGVSDETDSEKVFGEQAPEKKYTLGEKIGNWLYHSKWWLGIAVFVAFVAAFLIYDYVTHDDPDLYILVLTQNAEMYTRQQELTGWIADVCPDYDGDGKQEVNMIYIPVTKEMMEGGSTYASSINTQLMVQFQSATAMLVIADDEANVYLNPDDEDVEMFADLSELYPDCPLTDGDKLPLAGTNFAELIGLEAPLSEGTYLAIRQVHENMESLEKNQAAYDRAKTVLDALVPQLKAKEAE